MRASAAAQVALVMEDWLLGLRSSAVLRVVLFVEVTSREGLDAFLENRSSTAAACCFLRKLILVVLTILLLRKVSGHLKVACLAVIWHRV